MKGLDKIIGRIRADAQAEIDAIHAEGKARAAEVTAGYEAKAAELLRAEEDKSRLAAEAIIERDARGDAMDKSKALLRTKQESIDEAFALAAQKLRDLPRDEYIAVLGAIAASAGSGDEEIVLSAADAAAVGEQVVKAANALKSGAAFTLSTENRELEGGLILKSGSVEINCAFATQLRLLRQTMAADVAAILFS